MLASTEEVRAMVASGRPMVLAGDEGLLTTLPRGNWIGGTIPYFMTDEGGKTSRDRIFVREMPSLALACRIKVYDSGNIGQIGEDSPENGYTILILPAFTAIHQQYALEAPRFKDLFLKVVAGWVSGIHLDDLGRESPKVFDGSRLDVIGDRAVAMHVELPRSHVARIGIVNIFRPGEGDEIRFPSSGFQARECTVNGESRNFQEYFAARRLDQRLPLVANYCGALVNVSIQELDAVAGIARFYAPVFADVPYRLARPVDDYPGSFATAIPAGVGDPDFCCNCVLNYVYGQLEGRSTGGLRGPMTFGEIAYQLLNQTLVHLSVLPTDAPSSR